MKFGREIGKGREFRVYEGVENTVLKIPRFPNLIFIAFGNFRKKNEMNLLFMKQYFQEYLPPTEIIDLNPGWAIRQQCVSGEIFFDKPDMTPPVRVLLIRALQVYDETGLIPDLSNPSNLIREHGTGKYYIIDISVLGGDRWWPVGYIVTRLLGKILYKTIHGWLKYGFNRWH